MVTNVFGLFERRQDVEEAINDLRSNGFEPKDISIIMKDKSEAHEIQEDTGAGVAEGAVSGATTGAVLGGLAGLVSAIVLPGIGAFFIGGPLVAALGLTGAAATTVSGAATGALAGGVLGALMGLGLGEDEARTYESRIQEGAILLAVPASERDQDVVTDIFEKYNASDVTTASYDETDLGTRDRDYRRDESAYRPHFGIKGGRRDEHDR